MFTLEIGGRPIAVTDANEADAKAIFESGAFKQDLTALTSEGAPLWDGRAPLSIRPASQQEVAEFGAPEDDAADEEEDDGAFVTFLVPIDHDHEETLAVPPEVQS